MSGQPSLALRQENNMRVVFSFLRTLLGLVSITANLIAAEQNGGPA